MLHCDLCARLMLSFVCLSLCWGAINERVWGESAGRKNAEREYVSAKNVEQERVRLTNGEWPPFLSEHLLHHGIGSRIVSEAFAAEGITVEYGFFPWKRAYKYAKLGVWDGSVIWLWSKERTKLFYYSDPVIDSQDVFFQLREKPLRWQKLEDLTGLTIGATAGYFYGKAFEQAEKSGQLKVVRVNSDLQSLRRLLTGRIDACVINLQVGYFLLNQHFSDLQRQRISYHPNAVHESSWHLILSKQKPGNKQLLERFNRGLATLRNSGAVERYLKDAIDGDLPQQP